MITNERQLMELIHREYTNAFPMVAPIPKRSRVIFFESSSRRLNLEPRVKLQVQVTDEVTPDDGTKSGLRWAHDKAHDEAHEPMSEIEHRILHACFDSPQSTLAITDSAWIRKPNGKLQEGALTLDGFSLCGDDNSG